MPNGQGKMERGIDLREDEKHCDNCRYSYLEPEHTKSRVYLRQRCSSPDYNTSTYVHDNIMEDWGRDFCRFWTPKTQKG